MKLNLLPAYIQQAKRNRSTLIVMSLIVLAVLGAMLYQQRDVKGKLADAKAEDARLTPLADEVVATAAKATEIYNANSILFRNVELTWYIGEHNKKYPALYRQVAGHLPSYVRIVSLSVDPASIGTAGGAQPVWPQLQTTAGAQPTQPAPGGPPAPGGGDPGLAGGPQAAPAGQITVVMRAVLGNYQQYSDLMILLTRDKRFVQYISRAGFYQNLGQQSGGGDTGGRGAPPNWTTVDVVMRVNANVVAPNPMPALVDAAGAATSAAASSLGGGPGPTPGG